MKLTGIELRNFRAIGSEPVVLHPLRKCNILIGQNNAGKSSVLKAIQKISDNLLQTDRRAELTELDFHNRASDTPVLFKLHFEAESTEEIVRLAGTSTFFFEFSWPRGNPSIVDHTFATISDFNRANELFGKFGGQHWTGHVGPDAIRKQFRGMGNNFFGPFSASLQKTYFVPEFRQIRSGNEYSFDGTKLIETLAHYRDPDIGKDSDRRRFALIQDFVRNLLHLPKATIDIPRDNPRIVIDNNGLRLPLDYYGTGVHELVILVTAVLSIENSVCCIEEPEIHLHPRLQREFISFITQETNNQYLISTHSPTFINAFANSKDVLVFHLFRQNGAVVGGPVTRDEQSLDALRDLDVKASDILQSNCVIWVEGPSDRIYLKRWLELIAPDLAEGRDFSIMFYGGRLLAHLYADRETRLEELVHILRINQHAVVMIDSDKKSAKAEITATKRRIQEECQSSGNICWITDGREVENHISKRVLAASYEQLYGKQIDIQIMPYAKFEQVLSKATKAVKAKDFDYSQDKVRYARLFAEHYQATDISLKLKERIEAIATKIREWNG